MRISRFNVTGLLSTDGSRLLYALIRRKVSVLQ